MSPCIPAKGIYGSLGCFADGILSPQANNRYELIKLTIKSHYCFDQAHSSSSFIKTLIERVTEIRTQIVDEIFLQYIPVVYRYLLLMTGNVHLAEDLSQETLMRAWKKRKSLKDHAAGRSWILRIAMNLCRDHFRQQKRNPAYESISPIFEPVTDCHPAFTAELQEEMQLTLLLLDELPPRQKEVVYLSACEGMSHEEISTSLNLSPNAVKSHLHLGRKQLREKMKSYYSGKTKG